MLEAACLSRREKVVVQNDARTSITEANGKIVFANQLRGVAVLSVLIGHYFWVYWQATSTVATYILAPAENKPAPAITGHIGFPTFNYGPFGVALFFLISGFVIPFSIEKMGTLRFIRARFFRIFPTYWFCTGFTLCVALLSGRYWGGTLAFHKFDIVTNLLLVNPQFIVPSIDLVNWTLPIEILFYICSAIFWPIIRRGRLIVPVLLSIAILAGLTWAPTISMENTKYEFMFVSFLFIGTLFNFAFNKYIDNFELLFGVGSIFLAFAMMWQKTPLAGEFWLSPANYAYALVVFSACYALRFRFKRVRVLDFLADISYPLYLIHSVFGYAILRFAMAHGVPYLAALAIAFGSAVVAAYGVHIVIERPTSAFGRHPFHLLQIFLRRAS